MAVLQFSAGAIALMSPMATQSAPLMASQTAPPPRTVN
jgi:hypothetical protein